MAVTLGWLLVLVALASGLWEVGWVPYALALLLCGLALAAGAFRFRRFPLFAFGVIAAYAALSRLALQGNLLEALGCFWRTSSTPILVIVALILAQRRMKVPEIDARRRPGGP